MENKPLAERLRPKTLDDYIGQHREFQCFIDISNQN